MSHSHYFITPEGKKFPKTFKTISAIVLKHENNSEYFSLDSTKGLFSWKYFDQGSLNLLRTLEKKGDLSTVKSCLDLGCGYGLVGFFVKKKHPKRDVWMSDSNELATYTALHNSGKGGLETHIVTSDGFENNAFQDKYFDLILFNPPFSAGKEKCFNLIHDASRHLTKNGELWLVIPTNRGAKSYHKKIDGRFSQVRLVHIHDGYRIFACQR